MKTDEARLRALDLAAELTHSAHDCFYIALAEAERVPLITADKKLLGKLPDLPDIDAIFLFDAAGEVS